MTKINIQPKIIDLSDLGAATRFVVPQDKVTGKADPKAVCQIFFTNGTFISMPFYIFNNCRFCVDDQTGANPLQSKAQVRLDEQVRQTAKAIARRGNTVFRHK
jgi:hypothetical protein